ncbi:MAG: uracil-DNA glycosylase [Patescibacteria group bacterium]
MNSNTQVQMPEVWKTLLEEEFQKPYFVSLRDAVRAEYLTGTVFPHPTKLFRAFEFVKPNEVRVVILGQDPYHTPGVADGLAFSTLSQNKIPPSLQNIFKEIESEFSFQCEKNPDLSRWATQGVLLLNASLSVKSGLANSHAPYGWHTFTDAVISKISDTQNDVVFLLWGSFASKKSILIDSAKHLILTSPHPSPFSAYSGFFGNGHFLKANDYLKTHDRGEINWR